ncbi:MAG: TolC family protein, partial [Pseudomonadota bacterium]
MHALHPARLIVTLTVATFGLAGCAIHPDPLTLEQIHGFSDQVVQHDGPRAATLTVEQAIEAAVSRNLELRLADQETLLEEARLRASRASILPELLIRKNWSDRSPEAASRSSNSDTFSTSQDARRAVRDIELGWSILDFGLSYIRAGQVADGLLQREEEYRRVEARIAQETRATYWRAAALQHLRPELRRLAPRVSRSLRLAERSAQDDLLNPLDGLTFAKALLNSQREINLLKSSLTTSLPELRTLTGHAQTVHLSLKDQRARIPDPARINTHEDLVALA